MLQSQITYFVARNILQNVGLQQQNDIIMRKVKSEVLAMAKQLGIPTFFFTLSCADLRWNEILTIIRKLNEADFDISIFSYHDCYKIFNENPVHVASHLQYRLVIFFKILFVIDEPLG